MNIFVGCYWAFLAVWFFGGLALFAYIKWETLTRKTKAFIKKSKELYNATRVAVISGAKISAQTLMLLAPFLIPLAVTALSLYFSH